jgi:hypothetical protein
MTEHHRGGSNHNPANHLHLVPPTPVTARRRSWLALLQDAACSAWILWSRWVDAHFSYDEIDRDKWEWRLRGYCEDCLSRVDVIPVHGVPRCAACDGVAVEEIGSLYMRKGSEVEP